jgi:hypothetical protein
LAWPQGVVGLWALDILGREITRIHSTVNPE